MLYLVLCIFCSAALIFIFKYCHRLNIPVAQVIFINYIVCTVLGVLVLPGSYQELARQGFQAPWLWAALVSGGMFFVTFFLIALSARTAGVAITSVAQKVSLVIPVAVSLLWWKREESLGITNVAGLILAVVAVGLASWPRKTGQPLAQGPAAEGAWLTFLLPIVVFVNAGVVDTLINFVNYRYLSEDSQNAFTLAVFGTATGLGLGYQLYQQLKATSPFQWRSIPAGLVLGVPNLFSLVFLLKALSAFDNNGAFVYPINNMGVIVVSTIGGIILFRERLRKINWLGLGLALVALALLVMKEIKA